jgi:predicted PurR-regulated permease PerM
VIERLLSLARAKTITDAGGPKRAAAQRIAKMSSTPQDLRISPPPAGGYRAGPEFRGRTETIVALAALILLVLGCAVVLAPFLSAILWAGLLCFSTWGLFVRLRTALGGRKSLAALAMTVIIAAIAVVPFVIVGESLADNVSAMIAAVRHMVENGPRQPPGWLSDFPVAGPHIHDYMARLSADPEARRELVRNLAGPVRTIAVRLGAALGHGVLEISLSLLIGFFLYRDGDSIAARLDNAVVRIAGQRGMRLLDIAAVTVAGVVYGIIGTSLIQGLLAGIGFWIAGVPGAFLLAFATFLLGFIPMGPALIWLPASVWLLKESSAGWALFMFFWGLLVVGSMDHLLKPILISRSGGAPLILVMLGVFGGALAFGFIGVFIGPTLLAIGYALLDEWSGSLATKA